MGHQIAEEKEATKFNKLIEEGRGILDRCGFDGRQYRDRFPSIGDYIRFRTEAMNLIQKVCGKSSSHYETMKRLAESKEIASNSYHYADCFGVLEAAHRDFTDGMLADIRQWVRADLLDDFRSQAEALLEQGYHVVAASLAGAASED